MRIKGTVVEVRTGVTALLYFKTFLLHFLKYQEIEFILGQKTGRNGQSLHTFCRVKQGGSLKMCLLNNFIKLVSKANRITYTTALQYYCIFEITYFPFSNCISFTTEA